MKYPAYISPEHWNAVTERIFNGVGVQIRQTRKVQKGLRVILWACIVSLAVIVYALALVYSR